MKETPEAMRTDFNVTCIIPTHGRPAFLVEAIRSAAGQSLQPREIIIVTDDDDPAVHDVVSGLRDSIDVPVRVVARAPGSPGASASRNEGARVASTTWLAFLDDDDLWHSSYLENAAALIRSSPQLDAVTTGYFRFRDGVALGSTQPRPGMTARDAFRKSPGVTGSTLIVRRSVFGQLGGYDATLPVMNDVDFFIRFLLAGHRYGVSAFDGVGQRKHGAGQLTDSSRRRIDGGWVFLEKHSASFSRMDARPRRYWQYRMLARARFASVPERALGLLGMCWYLSPSPSPRSTPTPASSMIPVTLG
jgi:glycosyltransferase involved in cell wall biosynthesis